MATIKVKVPMSANGIKELYDKIHIIKKKFPLIRKKFISKSLYYIRNQANKHLREKYSKSWYRRTGELESSWNIFADSIKGELRNMCSYSAMVEYGTGLVGSHPLASKHNYEYNQNNHTSEWKFKPEGYEEYHLTEGLEGYWYVYRAVYEDYIKSGMAQKIFNEVFEGVVKRAIK